MENKQILNEQLEKGCILARATLQIVGKPKEHIIDTMKQVIKQIKDDPKMKVFKGDLFKPVQQEQLWSTFAELEILFSDKAALTHFCFDYMPASLDVLRPENLSFKIRDYNEIMASLLERIHQMDMVLKNLSAENRLVRENGLAMLRNLLIIAVGGKERSLAEISKIVGIPENQLSPFVAKLVKTGFFESTGDKIRIKKDHMQVEQIRKEAGV
ncbi:MAG TPA: hypothetical protein VJB08_03020 [Candidatus Nanoarchaeia archaeon]|nr:hypothetical protein [Candidatus Nanoarchaeia archaeon]